MHASMYCTSQIFDMQKLLASVDKVTAPDRPCHGGLWQVSPPFLCASSILIHAML